MHSNGLLSGSFRNYATRRCIGNELIRYVRIVYPFSVNKVISCGY